MQGLRRELLPPSGVEYATSLNLIPNTLRGDSSGKKTFRNLVVARSSYLRIYEIREEPAPLPMVENVGTSGRKGTEAVEGEVEMDHQGEGFVNVGVVKVTVCFYPMFCMVVALCNEVSFSLTFDYIRAILINWSLQVHRLQPKCCSVDSHAIISRSFSSVTRFCHWSGSRQNIRNRCRRP